MSIKLNKLNKTIIKCEKCPRLSSFIKKISKEKRKQNIDEKYWGKPVTGFVKFEIDVEKTNDLIFDLQSYLKNLNFRNLLLSL